MVLWASEPETIASDTSTVMYVSTNEIIMLLSINYCTLVSWATNVSYGFTYEREFVFMRGQRTFFSRRAFRSYDIFNQKKNKKPSDEPKQMTSSDSPLPLSRLVRHASFEKRVLLQIQILINRKPIIACRKRSFLSCPNEKKIDTSRENTRY